MTDVFLSYASEDRKKAAELVAYLEDAGLTVWWDQYLHVGTFFQKVINHELLTARCVVVLWSRQSVLKDWVLGEAIVGMDRGKLVAVELEPCAIPVPFNTRQTVVFSEEALQRILGEVQHTCEQAAELTRNVPPSAVPNAIREKPSVAVLPFEGRGEAEDELGEMVAAEVINSLSRFSTLQVIPRRSSFQSDLRSMGVREVAANLECEYIVSGTISLKEHAVRLLSDLSHGARDRQIWSGTFQEEMESLMDAGVSIAEKISRQLGGEFLRSEMLEAFTHQNRSVDVLQLMASAKSHIVSFNSSALRQSEVFLNQALALAPRDAQALALRASVLTQLMRSDSYAEADENGYQARATRDADLALSLAAEDPLVLKYCGSVYAACGSNQKSVKLLRLSMSTNPYDLGTWGYLAEALVNCGSEMAAEEALELLEFVLSESPRHPGVGFWQMHLATVFTLLGNGKDAVESAEQALMLQPDMDWAQWILINALVIAGQEDRALELAAALEKREGTLTAQRFAELVVLCAEETEASGNRIEGLRRIRLVD